MHIAMCDDERLMLKVIGNAAKTVFEEIYREVIIHPFLRVEKVDEYLKESQPDLLFLDIVMPKSDGIKYAQSLRERGFAFPIVFVTSAEERVWESFPVKPLGFIRKNNFLTDLKRVVEQFEAERAEKEKNGSVGDFVVSVKGKMYTLDVMSIRYIESQQHNQVIYFNDGREPLVITSQMQVLEERLSGDGFYRVHKGFLVNLRKVKLISAEGVILDDDTCIPINARNLTSFKHVYMEFQQKKR